MFALLLTVCDYLGSWILPSHPGSMGSCVVTLEVTGWVDHCAGMSGQT